MSNQLYLLSEEEEKIVVNGLLEKIRAEKHMKGFVELFKGTSLEVFLNHVLENKLGLKEEQIGWGVGSHGSGRDLCKYSIKSFDVKNNRFDFSGSRTQKYITLSDKLNFHNNPNFEKIIGVGINNNVLYVYFLHHKLFHSEPKDWTSNINKKGELIGFKTISPINGISMRIAFSLSHQFWYKCLNYEDIPKEFIKLYKETI